MPPPLFQVDAFTEAPFRGNPAAVCLLERARPAAWMQQVAREMNLSETAFVQRRGQQRASAPGVPRAEQQSGEASFDLRWFTPACEVDLCGHATLASAHVLWEEGWLEADTEAIFHTKSGGLTACRAGGEIVMDFPAEPPAPCALPEGLVKALGVEEVAYAGRNRMDVLVRVEDVRAVRALQPDMERLAEVEARGVIVTASGEEEGSDFVSRFFAPRAGVPEDPVTGSAHCALAPFWSARLGRRHLTGVQLSARGGRVGVEMKGERRVLLSGHAVTVLRGALLA